MAEWKSIDELFDYEKGTLQSSKCTPGKYTFITAAEEWKSHDTYTHDCEALIFAMAASGSLGRTHYVNGKFISSDLCFILTPKKGLRLDLTFYHRLFNFLRVDIVRKTATGTSKLAINQTNFGAYMLPYFEYEHQLNFRDKIEIIRGINEEFFAGMDVQLSLIDKLRQAVLQDAIEGKLTAEWRKQNPKLISGENDALRFLERVHLEKDQLVREKKTKTEFPLHNKAKKEPPFTLPSEWIWTRAWNVIWCFRGHNPPKIVFSNEPKEGFVRFIQITDFKTDSRAVYVPLSKSLKFVHKGEIVMAAYRHIGKLSRDMEGAFNVALCKVMNIPPFDIDYLELLIKSQLVTGELLAASQRGHIPSMHSNHLLSLWLPVPALAEQKAIVERVSNLMTNITDLEEQVSTRKEQSELLMQSVLQEAFEHSPA